MGLQLHFTFDKVEVSKGNGKPLTPKARSLGNNNQKEIEITTQNITATILDTATTPGYLVVEIECQMVRAEIADGMIDTAEALPQLVENLEKAGYSYYGEPTDEAGEVELVKLSR